MGRRRNGGNGIFARSLFVSAVRRRSTVSFVGMVAVGAVRGRNHGRFDGSSLVTVTMTAASMRVRRNLHHRLCELRV